MRFKQIVKFPSAYARHSGPDLANQIHYNGLVNVSLFAVLNLLEISLFGVAKQFTKRFYSGFGFSLFVSIDRLAPDFFLISILKRSSAISIIVSSRPERCLDSSSCF